MAKDTDKTTEKETSATTASAKDAAPASKGCLLVVGGTKSPLRATELGAQPLPNGSEVMVACDVAERLVAQYNPFLTVKDKDVTLTKALKNGYYEVTKVAEAEKAKVTAGVTTTDKSMDGKVKNK